MIEPLLVPVQLDALVVRPEAPLLALDADPPFADTPRALEPGVHLCWAPPDALTAGRLLRAASGWTIRRPAVPDRWLIVRYDDPAEAQGGRRTTRAWVLDARTGTAALLQHAIQLSDETHGPPTLTAQGRLGWHDDLRGVPRGPLSYAVFGWYATADDPLWLAGFDDDGQARPSLRAAWVRQKRWTALRNPDSDDQMDEHFPDHLLLHGAVVDVAWGGQGGRLSGRPGPRAPSAGLYPSAARALGELGLPREASARARRALEALACTIRQAPGVPIEDLALEAHAEAFRGVELEDGAPVLHRAADPVLAIAGGGRGFRHGHDGRFSPDGTLRCRAGLTTAITALAIDDPTPTPIPPVAARQILCPLTLHGPTRGEGHRRLLRELATLTEEVALLDPCNAGLLAAAWGGGGGGAHESALTTVAQFEVATSLCLSTAHPGAAALADGMFRGAGLLPSPIAITPWSQPWIPLFAEIEVDVHGRLDGAPDSAALWRLAEGELEPLPPEGPVQILPVAHATVSARVPLDSTVCTAASQRARPRRGYDSKGLLGEVPGLGGASLAEAEQVGSLDLLCGSVTGLLAAAQRELGSDLPQGALHITRLRLVDGFGTWATLVGAPDGGRFHAPAELRPPADDVEPLARVTPPGPGYQALLRPRLAAPARLRCDFGPIAGTLRLAPETVGLDALGRDGDPVWDRVRAWLHQADAPGCLSTQRTLRYAAQLRQLASLPGASTGLAVVRARLWIETEAPISARDLQLRLGQLGSRDDGLLGWFSDGDPRLHLVNEALIDPCVWEEAGWHGQPSPTLCGGADLPIEIGAATELILLLDPDQHIYVRTGFLPRVRFRLGHAG